MTRPVPARDRHWWTRDRFHAWLKSTGVPVFVLPYELAPCACDDVNCHGWRLVPVALTPRDDS